MQLTATENMLEVSPSPVVPAKAEAPFYSMSAPKLAVMLVCTSGVYQVYWFYKQWACVKRRERTNIRPVMRALFPVLFALGLGSKLDEEEQRVGTAAGVALQDFMGAWLMVSLALNFAVNPYSLLLGLVSFVPLPLVQARINRLNAAVTGEAVPATNFSAWSLLIIVPGAVFMILALVGTLAALA